MRAVKAVEPLAGVITPFPGGVCRAGSKVGALTLQEIVATIDEAYCPTLRDRVSSQLVEGAMAAYEIIINGVDLRGGGRGNAWCDRGGGGARGAGDWGSQLWGQIGQTPDRAVGAFWPAMKSPRRKRRR